MDKIIKALLEAKYPTANADALLEVINATPNASLATEILCGLHVEVKPFPMSRINDDRPECRLLEYNKWDNLVKYEYLRLKVISMYLPKDVDFAVITKDNYKQYAVSWKSDGSVKHYELKTDEFVKDTDSVDFDYWEKHGYIPDELVP